jgi:hypothetical protein
VLRQMADLSIQFHATPDELVEFVRKVVFPMDVRVTAVSFPPYTVKETNFNEIPKLIIEGLCRDLVFTEMPPCLPASTGGEFAERNPGALSLMIGKLTPRGLKESWLACRTIGSEINPRWKQIASKLRYITTAGVIAVNPTTGAISRSRHRRITEGAKKLNKRGVPLLPMAGTSIFRVEEPD